MGLSSEALTIAQESGDPHSRGIAHAMYGLACYAKRRLEDAENHSLEGITLCERIGVHSLAGTASSFLAEAYFEMNDYQKSRECYDQASRFYQRSPIWPSWVRWAQLGMARCGVMLGERDVSLEPLRAISEKNRMKVAEGWIRSFLGEIFLHLGRGHMTEAEHWIRKAIEADERNGMRFHLGRDYALYAEFFKRQDDRTKAQENLGKAIDILRERGADGWVEKYEKELTALQ